MSENTFPLYSADKIVTFYRNEVLTGPEAKAFTRADLTPSAKPEVVQTLYMRVLHLLFGFKPECHSMVPLLENIHNPSHYVGSTAILSVFTRMRQFLPMCLVHDFSLNDLLNPKKQRTLTILSGIMNFLHFRNQRMAVMLERQARFRSDLDRLQAYSKGVEEAERKIQQLTTVPPEQQAEADQLAAAISDLNSSTKQECQEVNSLKESIAEWKSITAQKSQKLAQSKVDISCLKEDISRLRSQIVESPEELKSQMEKMRENVKSIKSCIEDTDERVVELQNMVQSSSHSEADIQQMLFLLQDLETSMKNCKHTQEEHQALLSVCERRQKELKNLCVEEGRLKRALDMKLDKKCKQQMRRQKKREMKEQHVKEVLGQCNQVHQKRQDMADKIQDLSAETQDLKVQMKILREECSRETERAQALYNSLSCSIEELHRRIHTHTSDLKSHAHKLFNL